MKTPGRGGGARKTYNPPPKKNRTNFIKFNLNLPFRTRCATTSSTYYEIGDLEPGREYAFAVLAANDVGESDPLQAAKTIVAKDQFSELF